MNNKILLCAKSVSLSLLFVSLPVFAGSEYELKYDKFENKKVANYQLDQGTECRLNKTSKSTLYSCDFLAVSTERLTPSIIMVSTSSGWDILTYRSVSPYSEKKAPAIITYKNGTKKNMRLPATLSGDIIRGRTVAETVFVTLGGLRQELLSIDNIELKYGTNEYYIKLDNALTKKALNYRE